MLEASGLKCFCITYSMHITHLYNITLVDYNIRYEKRKHET